MFTESFSEIHSAVHVRASRPAYRSGVLASATLAADLAADPADLLDVSAALGLASSAVIEALLRAPDRSASSTIRSLAAPEAWTYPPHGGTRPPFVWVSLTRPGRLAARTVRAGWLVPAAVDAIAAEALRAGRGTEIHVIVPLDGDDGTAASVYALCAGFPRELTVTIEVQSDERPLARPPGGARTSKWRPSGARPRDDRRGRDRFRPGTWIVLDPSGAAS